MSYLLSFASLLLMFGITSVGMAGWIPKPLRGGVLQFGAIYCGSGIGLAVVDWAIRSGWIS